MSCQALSYAHQLPGPYAERALRVLLSIAEDEQQPAADRISAARLLLEDRNHKELQILADLKRQDQSARASDLKTYRAQLTLHRKQTGHQASRRVRLGHKRYKLSKKTAKQSLALKERALALREQALLAAKETREIKQVQQKEREEQKRKAAEPTVYPPLILKPVSPSAEQEALRISLGIPRGGVPLTGPSSWYYDDKPELKAQLEKEHAELALIRAENERREQAALFNADSLSEDATILQPIASAMGTDSPETEYEDEPETDKCPDSQSPSLKESAYQQRAQRRHLAAHKQKLKALTKEKEEREKLEKEQEEQQEKERQDTLAFLEEKKKQKQQLHDNLIAHMKWVTRNRNRNLDYY